MRVMKRDGTEVAFDTGKIQSAILKAVAAVRGSGGDEVPSTAEVETISARVAERCEELARVVGIEEIQDMIIDELDRCKFYKVARVYSDYRVKHELLRKQNSTDAKVLSLLRHENEIAKQENANKNPVLNSTLRDYLASEVSEDICRRYIFPEDVILAHDEGILHLHDLFYQD